MASPLQLSARAAGPEYFVPKASLPATPHRARIRPSVARLLRRSNDQSFSIVTFRQVRGYTSETLTHSLVAFGTAALLALPIIQP